MELTEEKIKFLDRVCKCKWTLNSDGEINVDGKVDMSYMNLTEIPIKFGRVKKYFDCSNNNLTTLKNCPIVINNNKLGFHCGFNNLTEYFKNIKEEDFGNWKKLNWFTILDDYPFLINIGKKYFDGSNLKDYLNLYPITKLYYKD